MCGLVSDMKYIRTKDGKILELARFHDRTTHMAKGMGYITLIDKLKICDYEIRVKDIVKQADTIEELCDEFVIHYAYGYHLITLDDIDGVEIAFKDNFDYGFMLKFALENDYEIYGAIWAIDGNGAPTLKSVAKANKKGEFDLLKEVLL